MVTETITLKYWKTRSGHKAVVWDTKLPTDYYRVGYIIGKNEVISWRSCGRSGPNVSSNFDLLTPWLDDLEFDASCLPKWATHIAMNPNGSWRWYNEKPVTVAGTLDDNKGVWMSTDVLFGAIPIEFTPKNLAGNWEDSLHVIYNGKAVLEKYWRKE